MGDRPSPFDPLVHLQPDLRETGLHRNVLYVVDDELLQHAEVEI
jgi:hypothetical protein